ncbi:MAG: hypothetical protein HDT41_00450 [Lachnospiraceae bacterium]|nr:hypothetical protein [Lachnospiraceae bacterium]
MNKELIQINDSYWEIDGYSIHWVNAEYFSVSKFNKTLFRTEDLETALDIIMMLNLASGKIKINGKFYECVIDIESTAWNADMITIHLPEGADTTNWYHSVRLKTDLPPCFRSKF